MSGIIEGVGGYKQGKSQSKLMRQQARVAEQQGLADEEAMRRQAREILGAQAAAMAQSGTGPGGSNELIARQSAALAELDALNIRYRGQMQAKALRKGAKSAKQAGLFALLAGVADTAQSAMGGG
jgi:hypothetical protein